MITELGQTQWLTLLVGVLSLAVVLVCKHWFPLVPGSLLAVLLGTGASVLFDLQTRGVEIVGEIDSGLPHVGLAGRWWPGRRIWIWPGRPSAC